MLSIKVYCDLKAPDGPSTYLGAAARLNGAGVADAKASLLEEGFPIHGKAFKAAIEGIEALPWVKRVEIVPA